MDVASVFVKELGKEQRPKVEGGVAESKPPSLTGLAA